MQPPTTRAQTTPYLPRKQSPMARSSESRSSSIRGWSSSAAHLSSCTLLSRSREEFSIRMPTQIAAIMTTVSALQPVRLRLPINRSRWTCETSNLSESPVVPVAAAQVLQIPTISVVNPWRVAPPWTSQALSTGQAWLWTVTVAVAHKKESRCKMRCKVIITRRTKNSHLAASQLKLSSS